MTDSRARLSSWHTALQNLHTVSFPKPGFVELRGMAFDVDTEITLSFSTKSDKGIILFGSGGVPVPPRRRRRQTGEVSRHGPARSSVHQLP